MLGRRLLLLAPLPIAVAAHAQSGLWPEWLGDYSGARWPVENLLGTVLLRRKMTAQAEAAFEQALKQSELWLSRTAENPGARAGEALALAGSEAVSVSNGGIVPLFYIFQRRTPARCWSAAACRVHPAKSRDGLKFRRLGAVVPSHRPIPY